MLNGQYETPLVWISILVAMLASYTALSLAGRVAHSGKAAARWWIGAGAFAMGTGIWAMHFIGMLAFRLPVSVGYDLGITFLSWLIPVIVSALALWQVSRARLQLGQLAVSAVLMGIGINVMHYVGMAAMRMQPGIVYDPVLVSASVAIAIGASAASLWIAFSLSRSGPGVWIPRAGGAAVMGLGIAGMHYTGMASANFPLGSVCMASGSGLSLDGLALTVIIATLAVLSITLLTSGYDARLTARNKTLGLAQEIATERQVMLEREQTARAEAERARAGAERMSALKDEFLATLSHELRTPLSAILGWAQLMQVRANNDVALQNGLQTIERNARAQGQLIEDLLDMSGMVSGKIRLEMDTIEPAALLEAAIDTALPAAARKSIAISRMLDGDPGVIRGDPARLQQVIGNLLTNAIKFTPDGGAIHVTLARARDLIDISISDTGVGIPPDFLPHVFDLFRQADSSTTRRHGGLGIGLSIVRQLVELHGGTVSASSAGEGNGSTFRIVLPLLRSDDAITKSPAGVAGRGNERPFTAVDLSGLNVLVVDDEADARQLVRAMLEECNATVITAASAGQALALLTANNPDVLVSDIGMPDMDGLELMRQVRALKPGVSAIPAIALSAYSRERDRELALKAGYTRYLTKPIEGAQLVLTVASLKTALASLRAPN